MPREPNAVDFWRGLALITIFINHIPGYYFSRFTFSSASVADSADLFVFLAGWSLRYVVGRGDKAMRKRDIMMRLFGRALELYAAQVLITMVAIAVLAMASLALQNPLLLEWNNAAAVFSDPVPTHIGLAVLTHQLGYFDILPLYVALMLMAPAFAAIDRVAPALLVPLSLALYFAVLIFQITLPTWPESGIWFFNPFAWQLVFVLGFVFARGDDGLGAFARRSIVTLRIVALPVLLLGSGLIVLGLWPDPTSMPEPKLFFIADKTWETPVRLLHFLSIVAVFSLAFPYLRRAAQWGALRYPLGGAIALLAMLGRNSLYVFCVGSLMSLCAQVTRFVFRGTVGVDLAVLIIGIFFMAVTAWLAEFRERGKSDAPAR